MSNRVWVHQRMTTNAPFMALIPGGAASTTAQEVTPDSKPFIIHRSLAHRPSTRGDDNDITRAESFLIFVHDVPGDYLKIDNIIKELKTLFNNAKDEASGIARCTWVEDSEDFRDEDMGTILRYSRFQIRYLPTVQALGS